MSCLTQHPDCFQPPEDFLDPFTLSLTDRIPGMTCSAVIDGARPVSLVLSHMRRYLQAPDLLHKVLRVVGLVSSNGDALLSRQFAKHVNGGLAFRSPRCLCDPRINGETISVLHRHVSEITQLRLLAFDLLIQSRIWIGRGLVRLVRSLFALEINGWISRIISRIAATVSLFLEALLSRPRLNQDG
jgi:hypothetical protein